MADITLLGATGFTGGLTAEYLARHLPPGSSWAIAGRRQSELEALAERLAELGGIAPSVVVADASDSESMRSMAESTRVLITTVGPYLQYGEAAVKAAAEAGIGYVDLTGEPQFVDEMWLKYDNVAKSTGATLVHACGFDSVPYDLGVLYTVQQLPENAPLAIRGYIRAGATFSGGTYHSAINQFHSMRASARAAKKRRNAETRPVGRRVRGDGKIGRGARGRGWALPLPTIDPQIVLRSARTLDRYGPEFTYSHFAQFKGLPMLVGTMVGAGILFAGSQWSPTRNLLLKLKDPGSGPSAEQRAKSWFELTLLGHGGGREIVTRVSGGDPGYTETAKMLSESAMCLAFDDVPNVSGQTTTAVAMGNALIDRLVAADITFARVEPT